MRLTSMGASAVGWWLSGWAATGLSCPKASARGKYGVQQIGDRGPDHGWTLIEGGGGANCGQVQNLD